VDVDPKLSNQAKTTSTWDGNSGTNLLADRQLLAKVHTSRVGNAGKKLSNVGILGLVVQEPLAQARLRKNVNDLTVGRIVNREAMNAERKQLDESMGRLVVVNWLEGVSIRDSWYTWVS
jgi:hypothetical protein